MLAKANEVGHAQKPLFVARYLRLRDLQREIEEGLDVRESSNGANFVIAYGKGGEIASNRRDEQKMFVLCLRILQSALVHVNTLMLQDIPLTGPRCRRSKFRIHCGGPPDVITATCGGALRGDWKMLYEPAALRLVTAFLPAPVYRHIGEGA
ncbi:Tn3 family transposase [Streptomyces rimosus]|uniref:Tn3 family transposase n=1 Tax=Streptomyces TaxID=1883 RepID=UPI001CF5B15C|nr:MULTISPECIES: Tn3 family transposase [Streptomyces]